MTVLLDSRPGGLDHFFRPGDPFTAVLTWPAGYLAGRTFTATLGAASLEVTVDGDVMTVAATAAQTAAAAASSVFALVETVVGDPVTNIVGTWAGSERAAVSQSASVDVAAGVAAVTVTVAAAPGSAPSRLLDSAEVSTQVNASLAIGNLSLIAGSAVTVPDTDRTVILQGRGPLVCTTTAGVPVLLGIVPAGGAFADRLDEGFGGSPTVSSPVNVQTEARLAPNTPGEYQLYIATYSFTSVNVRLDVASKRLATLRAVEL